MLSVPPLTWLYVPADRPDRVEKAIASAAHAVIVDLEDGVAPAAQGGGAREPRRRCSTAQREKPVYVRINSPRTSLGAGRPRGDRRARGRRRRPHPEGRRPRRRRRSAGAPARAEREPYRFHCLIESAAGVEAAYDTARGPAVAGISLGEADLRSETGALEEGLDWARAPHRQRRRRRRPAAPAAVGLPAPARRRGPRALVPPRPRARPPRPRRDPSRAARDHRAGLPADGRGGRARPRRRRRSSKPTGAGTLESGEFVDAAMLAAAQQMLGARRALRHRAAP